MEKTIKTTVNIMDSEIQGRRGVLKMYSSELFRSPTKHFSEMLANCGFFLKKKENKLSESEKLKNLQQECMIDVQKFRNDLDEKITFNEKNITDVNLKIAKEKKQIDDLEQKNKDLKKQLDEYEVQTKASWISFKSEFNYYINMLDQELRCLIANTKNQN